jgi:hypothetical protein
MMAAPELVFLNLLLELRVYESPVAYTRRLE